MKKLLISFALVTAIINVTTAQKYYTKNATVSFFSKTNMEDIKADNNQVMSVLNAENGQLQFSLLVKGFHFEKALMEEHFNENYLESDKYPKSSFKGTVTDISKVTFTKDGVYPVNVTGELTMHGATKTTTTKGSITIKAGKVSANAKFIVKLADFGIEVPKLVKDNISQNQEVTVSCNYDQKM